MFEKEAEWIANQIHKGGLELSPMLNVGSSTLQFRTVEQPFIHEIIVSPFEGMGGRFVHVDLKREDGVDLAGDLMDQDFREVVKSHGVRSILCSNLLEHVEDPKVICSLLADILLPGGFIVITVPYRYPYHPDPIDTMFRPHVRELENMFPGYEVADSEILTIERSSHFSLLMKQPRQLFITIIRTLLPFYKFQSWKHIVGYIPHTFKPFQVACISVKKSTSTVCCGHVESTSAETHARPDVSPIGGRAKNSMDKFGPMSFTASGPFVGAVRYPETCRGVVQ